MRKKIQIMAVAIIALTLVVNAQAAIIYQTVHNSGWTQSVWGTPAAAPVAGNDYVMVGTLGTPSTLRGLATGENFAGDSFTLENKCKWLNKATGALIKMKDGNGPVICNQGATIQCAPNWSTGGKPATTWDMGDFIVNGSTLMHTNNELIAFIIAGTLKGAGNIRLQSEDDPGTGNGMTWTFEAVSGYTGTITVGNPQILDFSTDVEIDGAIVLEEAIAGNSAGRLNVDVDIMVASVTASGVKIANGTYSGAGLTAIPGGNFIDGGGTLIVGPLRGRATNLAPTGTIDKEVYLPNQLTWSAPVDPNIVSVTFDVKYYSKLTSAVTPQDPNFLVPSVVTLTNQTSPVALTFDYDKTYFWQVISNVTWDCNDITGNFTDAISKYASFVTFPDNLPPDVDAGQNVISWLAHPPLPAALSGTVDNENTSLTIDWDIISGPGFANNAAMQMINRTGAGDLAELAQNFSDPNLLRDWIGTDTRSSQNVGGSPVLTLTISGLPDGTYNWKSYHHDIENQTGTFDVEVIDASGSSGLLTGYEISDSNEMPVETVERTGIQVSGGNAVVVKFNKHKVAVADEGSLIAQTFFVMNGFELSDGVNPPLMIDFQPSGVTPANTMTGYQAYAAQHENAASFTAQPFDALGTTGITVLPSWNYAVAQVTDTTAVGSELSPTASFDTLTTTFPVEQKGTYTIKLTATDDIPASDSDTLLVTVAADACAAAKAKPGFALNYFDDDDDCDVDIDDFAAFAEEWLVNQNLTGSFFN